MSKGKVLFLCSHNAARSQMAEAFLRRLAPDRFEAFSAGLAPTAVDPIAVQVMDEVGIDIAGRRAKGLEKFLDADRFDYLITVCNHAAQECPTFPGAGTRLHWPFADPVEVEGDGDDRLEAFREVRDQIQARIRAWLAATDAK